MKSIWVLAGLLLTMVAGAAHASAWGARVTVTGYYVYATGGAYLTTSSNQNPDSCASTQFLSLDTSSARFKEIYAMLMTAQATGSTVSVLYDGCVGDYPRISSVVIPGTWW